MPTPEAPVRADPRFLKALAPFNLAELEATPASVCGLWRDLTLAYVNPAWLQFGRTNGAPEVVRNHGIGTSYVQAVAPPLRDWYEALLLRALSGTERVDHDYECSSADLYRVFHMSVFPLRQGAGLLIVHTLSVERPHDPVARPSFLPDPARYFDEHGHIVQCMQCRRTQQANRLAWDWVPAWVRDMPARTSHGLCPVCARYYFGDIMDEDEPGPDGPGTA